MKKLLIVILSVIASVCFTVGFTGCGKEEQPSEHVHTYSTEWTSDETYHWHKATCEHGNEIADKAEHNFVDGKCSVCNRPEPEKLITEKVDYKKVAKAFAENAYTVKVGYGDAEVFVALNFKDLFLKAQVQGRKILIDETGIYYGDNGNISYVSFDAATQQLIGVINAYVEKINSYLPEGCTVFDLMMIFYDGENFCFNAEKATEVVETFFKDGVTLEDVKDMVQDGLTYAEVEDILSEETLAIIASILPDGMELEDLVGLIANVTPERLEAIVTALVAGELDEDLIAAILPEGVTVEMINEYLPEDLTLGDIIAAVNFVSVEVQKIDFAAITEAIDSAIEKLQEIDWQEMAEEQKEAQIAALNAFIDACFKKERVGDSIKYTLNYDIIKEINEYFKVTTLETLINSVAGEGFVDTVSAVGYMIADTPLTTVKALIEGYIGTDLATALDIADEYATVFAPIVNGLIYNATGEEIDVLPYVTEVVATIKEYLADEEFMNKTIGEAIAFFVDEEEFTADTVKGYIDYAVNYLKENTVYSAFFTTEKAAEIYARINAYADMLNAKLPVYFVMDNAGELAELSVKAVLQQGEVNVSVKKGDLVGEILTEEEKDKVKNIDAPALDDLEGYEYVDGNVTVSVSVEEDGENGTIIITRTETFRYSDDPEDKDVFETEYTVANADLAGVPVTVRANGDVRYYVFNVNFGYYPEWCGIVFGEDGTWLVEDDIYYSQAEDVAA